MAPDLSEESGIDSVEARLMPDGRWVLNVRTRTRILRGGEVIAETFHRQSLAQADDLAEMPGTVQAIAAAVWG